MAMVLNTAAGKVFDELLSAVVETKNKAVKFRPTLKRLESKLRSIEPLAKQIDDLNKQLDRPDEETQKLIDLMKKGKKLVVECSKVQRWNCCYKANYQDKLEDLIGDIGRFFKFEMQGQMHRSILETQLMVNDIHGSVTKNDSRRSGIKRRLFLQLMAEIFHIHA